MAYSTGLRAVNLALLEDAIERKREKDAIKGRIADVQKLCECTTTACTASGPQQPLGYCAPPCMTKHPAFSSDTMHTCSTQMTHP